MRILVINGPNLNMLGVRERGIYGDGTLRDLEKLVREHCKRKGIKVSFYQSNHEGDLVTAIQRAMGRYDGIVINPGAYTHTSIAILDAAKAIQPMPIVEVHISDVASREAYRQVSYIREAVVETVSGKGIDGYLIAVDVLSRQ